VVAEVVVCPALHKVDVLEEMVGEDLVAIAHGLAFLPTVVVGVITKLVITKR
jgi:hypothetical protein